MSESNQIINPADVSAVMGAVDTYVRWKAFNGKPRGYETYHPSAFGKCLRTMQYWRYVDRGYISVAPDEMESKLIRLFDKGHGMHSRWAKYAEAMGILRGYWSCLNPFCNQWNDKGEFDPSKASSEKSRMFGKDDPIGCFKPKACICGCQKFEYHEVVVDDKSLNFHGHADMIWDFSNFNIAEYKEVSPNCDVTLLPKKPIVVDMKTCNDFKFTQVIKKGPGLDYRVQLTIYANILPVEYGLLIYENKNNSDVATYKISKNTDTIFSLIQKQATQMNEMVDKKLLPPPRPQDKDDYECSNCPFKGICHKSKIWSDPELGKKRKDFYGNLL